ncbi:MAG: orotidine-5'-phosphate decarboxylase [Gammaproteobacteria bacterium]|nr:orotidine-5'-phosphate decarboxylase [Gammaproteobacteria bacterium]
MSKLIIALDFDDPAAALSLAEQLEPKNCALKIGSELFTRAGPGIVHDVVTQGFRVFLDLKFHDIPNTVAQACKSAADLGVWMLTVHASGGPAMLQAAREAVETYGAAERPKIVAVTVLTSMAETTLPTVGVSGSLQDQVARLAAMTEEAGLDGVVSSAQEASFLRQQFGAGFLLVTPGIRLPGDATDDQSRVFSVQDALDAGSDYLVMGRSITRAEDPLAVVQKIQRTLNQA